MKNVLQKALPKIIGATINAQALYNPRKAALRAFIIFCSPRLGRIAPEQVAFLEAATSERLIDEKREIQTYQWKGSGKSVLLIHGWESNSYRWFKLVEDLKAQDYHIIAMDAPAHGNSSGKILNVPRYAAAIERTLQHYKPEMIVGHSIGALATIFHNYTYKPQTLEKMVLLGSASELDVIMQDYKRILGLNSRVMKHLEALVVQKFGFTFKEFSGAAFAKAVSTPALIIHDKFDKITPVEASREIHKNMPNSIYVETEGFGHSLYQETVREKVLEFIRA